MRSQDAPEPFFEALGRRCILWSRGGDRSTVAGLPLEVVERVEDADFLLLAGVEDTARLEDFSEQLEAAAAYGLPMVCANPDIIALLPDGGFGLAPGAVAHHYDQLGGSAATSASRIARSTRPASRRSGTCRVRRC
jgi:ribonucleotide monophosphatase NagD (HAD superfamily)